MPHKDAVAELVDHCTPEAAALHAVNCVVATADGLVGENTDGPGFLDALRAETGFEVDGRRAVVLGAGGAARAIVLALSRAGAAEVSVVNRTAERAEIAAALAGPVGRVSTADAIEHADLVVNATSVGMGDGRTPFDAGRLAPGRSWPTSCTTRRRRPWWPPPGSGGSWPSTASACSCTRPGTPSGCGPASTRRSEP